MPAKKILPPKIVSGACQKPFQSVKRKSSQLASIGSKPAKKAKITPCAKAVESDDSQDDLEMPDHEGEGEASEQRAPSEQQEDKEEGEDDEDSASDTQQHL
jgi:hypothetical protein